MVGVDELSVAHLSSVLPLSVVVAAGGRVSVGARAVLAALAPLAVVDVAVHVRVLAAAVTLVVRPVASIIIIHPQQTNVN